MSVGKVNVGEIKAAAGAQGTSVFIGTAIRSLGEHIGGDGIGQRYLQLVGATAGDGDGRVAVVVTADSNVVSARLGERVAQKRVVGVFAAAPAGIGRVVVIEGQADAIGIEKIEPRVETTAVVE